MSDIKNQHECEVDSCAAQCGEGGRYQFRIDPGDICGFALRASIALFKDNFRQLNLYVDKARDTDILRNLKWLDEQINDIKNVFSVIKDVSCEVNRIDDLRDIKNDKTKANNKTA